MHPFSGETREAQTVRALWQALTDEADNVDFSLEDTKGLFSETTRKQVRVVCVGGGGASWGSWAGGNYWLGATDAVMWCVVVGVKAGV